MNTITIVKQLFDEFASKVGSLPESDLSNIARGTHELVIRVTKKKRPQKNSQALTAGRTEEILAQLNKCVSRKEGLVVLSRSVKTKKELEQLAKFLDVFVLKKDKAEQIKGKIVEATVGAVLRSVAIQGKKHHDHHMHSNSTPHS